ncbi:MAG: NADH:flavin oxidoreductase [Phenylobacterium sp.]|jgi:2,4-dienoyl-CoA reductase-like NADH-dependent reductase (Old Yellow Enzyme family)|uniref:NADH:flavin oxidoreductase n=1 Tax=Phenylobacterium sp. TaxID=1871053 RepID=UPI0025D5CDE3|nr:NADH:flavin oxidoreductase [Phenylobacterium sp.]MCA6297605.1 NADH:flavin oxidoreductase [Phenylobacterium sp.]
MTDLFAPMSFIRGPAMKNRLMLAPLTNLQSHPGGTLSYDEHRWLTLRAQGGFGLTMTAAAHVQAIGQGFPGQVGIFSDVHIPGLARLAEDIRKAGSLGVVQLHHAGMRSPAALIGEAPVCPSEDADTGSRALTLDEVHQLRDDFIAAAVRADKAGFDGVEIHGAHGYVLCQFLSAETNRRTDAYGGSPENRARLILEIIDGVRASCRPDFNLGLRLSPERFGLSLMEIRDLAGRLFSEAKIDYLDMSLWDCFKEPVEEAHRGRTLMSYFTDLPRGDVRLGVAGKLMSAADARAMLDAGADFVLLGRAAILHHDWPQKARANPDFRPVSLPVTRAHLEAEGLGPTFVNYMSTWAGFVEG